MDSRTCDTRFRSRNIIPWFSKEQICTTQEGSDLYLLGSGHLVDSIVMDSDSGSTINAQEMFVWITLDRGAVERHCLGDIDCFYCFLYTDCVDTDDATVSFNRRGYNGESCYDADGLLPGDSHCRFCKSCPRLD